VRITTYQPDTKSNPNANPDPDPNTKQHATENREQSTKYRNMSYV